MIYSGDSAQVPDVGWSEVAMRSSFSKLMIFAAFSAIAAHATSLPFLQDNFAKARAEATQRKLPIFVECWAPW